MGLLKKAKCIAAIITVFLLAGIVSACSVTGISYEQPEATPTPTPELTAGWDENVLMTVDGAAVDYREALLLLLSAKEEAELLYGEGIWTYTLDEEGTTFGSLRKEQVLNRLTELRIACLHAQELGVDIYEEENRDINEYTSEFIDNVGHDSLIRYNITEALIKQFYTYNTLALKVYESITLSVDTDISDEEARQMKVHYIMKSKYTKDDDGNSVPFAEEELAALRESVQTLRDTGMTKDNFASYAELNTDAKDGVERFIGSGSLPEEVERIAMTLADGEFSPVIETDEAFYIVKCVTAFDEDATAAKKEEMIAQRHQERFAETFAGWKENAVIVINREKWDALEP